MKDLKTLFWASIGFVGVLILWVLIFTAPFYLVWNCIISTKFNLPHLTFSETFFIILVIKWLFSTSDINGIKQKIDNK
jgi:hypothetical protein